MVSQHLLFTPSESDRLLPKSKRTVRNRRTSRNLSLNPLQKSLPVIEKAAVGLFRWAITDHSGLSQSLSAMPSMGFVDSLKYILCRLLIAIVCSVLSAILVFVLVAYVVPFLLIGAITW